MPIWKTAKGWRYQFQHKGKRYSRAWFKTKREAQDALAADRRELTTPKKTPTGMVFSTLSNEYLDYCQRRFAKSTYAYKTIVYRRFLSLAGDLPVDQITLTVLEAVLRTRTGNISYNRHRKDLCALFTWAWRRRLIQDNPCHFLEKMPEPKFDRKMPTQEEIAKILLAAGPDRPLLLVVYHTVARIDEVLRLRWEDVNFTEETVRLWTRKRRGGAWEWDLIPMNQVLYNTLWQLWKGRQQEEWVFLNPTTSTRYIRRPKLMRGICRRAGVPPYGFHAPRHYVAYRLYDTHKWSTAKVSRILRHTSKATTEKYLQVVDSELRTMMASLEENYSQDLLIKS